MTRYITIAVLAAALAACGTRSASDAGIHLATRQRPSPVSEFFTRPVEIKAAPIITQALAYTAADLTKFGLIVRIGGAQGESLLDANNLEQMTKVVVAQANSAAPPAASFVAKFPELTPTLKGAAAPEILRAVLTGQIAAASTLPLNGWEVSPLDAAFDAKKCEMGDFFARGLDCPAVKQKVIDDYHKTLRYTYTLERMAHLANGLYARLAHDLDAPVSSEIDARAAIVETLLAIPPAETKALWESYQEPTDTQLDMSGKGGIAWVSSNGQFSVTSAGIIWTKNGTVWYGDGRVNGNELTMRANPDYATAIGATHRG